MDKIIPKAYFVNFSLARYMLKKPFSQKKSQFLIKQLRQKETELAVLYKITEAVSTLELDKILHEIVNLASKLTKADSCLVYLLDHRTDTLVLRASKNPHKKMLGQIKMKLGEGITGWVAREKKVVAIAKDAVSDSRFKFFTDLPEDRYEAFLSAPILNTHGVVGVINIQHKNSHTYTDNEIALLSAVGKIVGGAVENARLVEESLTLKEALETRKLLEKAKGILMRTANLSEEEAHLRIQKQSMNSRRSLREVAEAILLADSLLTK